MSKPLSTPSTSRIAQNNPDESPAMIDSSQLLQQNGRVVIRHGDKRYLLQQTRQGKLIMTGVPTAPAEQVLPE